MADQPQNSAIGLQSGRDVNLYNCRVAVAAGGSEHRDSDSDHSSQVDGVLLSDSIWFFGKRPLARRAKVFEGVKTSKITGSVPLAIKLIYPYTEQNVREARNLEKLKSQPHVVTIHHADEYKPVKGMTYLYIAMEKCSKLNLENYIKERRANNVPFNPIQAFEHAKQVIDAINHIHEQNIMHRDLKPSSVLFSLCGEYLKICDFGLSKELQDGRSVTGLSTLDISTDGYRAPETYNKGEISKKADIFSLALVLYRLLSYGFHPFGTHPVYWNSAIKKGESPDLSGLRVPFLEIGKQLLEGMLKFEPKDRPTIDQVKKSEFMNFDLFTSIIESLVLIWDGAIKDDAGADMLSCQLYRSPSLQDVIEIDGSDWKFQMNTDPYLDIGSFKKVTDEEPSGYIVTSSKDELKKLTDKLMRNNLMGWIDISKDGKESEVIVLLFQPGYPELFGFFLPDAKSLTSLVERLAGEQRPTPEPPAGASSNLEPALTMPAEPAFQQEPAKEKEVTSAATNQWKETKSENNLIPWWIFTGDR